MSNYRVVSRVSKDTGLVTFWPQCRFLKVFWVDIEDEGSSDSYRCYYSLSEAKKFLKRESEKESIEVTDKGFVKELYDSNKHMDNKKFYI